MSKYKYYTTQEIDAFNNRLKRGIWIVVVSVVVLLIGHNVRMKHIYKSAIYEYERATHLASYSDEDSELVQLIGKPNKAYYYLRHRPKDHHFWDRY